MVDDFVKLVKEPEMNLKVNIFNKIDIVQNDVLYKGIQIFLEKN